MSSTAKPRGIRNNNPGNIRWNGVTAWEGMTGADNDGFVQFISPEYGIRAMVRILKSYERRGVDTVSEIIATWAPPSENDTDSYIMSVVARTEFDMNSTISEPDYVPFLAAIIHHENGQMPYSVDQIQMGIDLA